VRSCVTEVVLTEWSISGLPDSCSDRATAERGLARINCNTAAWGRHRVPTRRKAFCQNYRNRVITYCCSCSCCCDGCHGNLRSPQRQKSCLGLERSPSGRLIVNETCFARACGTQMSRPTEIAHQETTFVQACMAAVKLTHATEAAWTPAGTARHSTAWATSVRLSNRRHRRRRTVNQPRTDQDAKFSTKYDIRMTA
jgi:hypothetical protein